MPGTNTLAYLASFSSTKEKSFIKLTTGAKGENDYYIWYRQGLGNRLDDEEKQDEDESWGRRQHPEQVSTLFLRRDCSVKTGNTEGGSIIVPLTSCLTGLE